MSAAEILGSAAAPRGLGSGFVLLQAPPDASPFGSLLIPMLLVLGIFYFLTIRPQQKRQQEHEAELKAIEKGDSVVTAGGLHGKVVGLTEDVLTVEIAALKGERVRVKVSRTKVDSVSKAKKGEEAP